MGEINEYKKTTKELIEKVGCDYQVFTSKNTAQEVQEAYFKALKTGKEEGFTPVLVVSDDTLAEWFGILEDEDAYSKETVIDANVDGEKFLKERFDEYLEDYGEDNDYEESELTLHELIGDLEAAQGEVQERFMAYESYSGDSIEEVVLFQIPVKNPWEIVAWLPMGGWNECPCAEDMLAVARYWYEKYGAVIATVSHDTLEFYVEEKVRDKKKALDLAEEMYGFCPDCVDQGTGSIAELYAGIRQSNVWFFWWD